MYSTEFMEYLASYKKEERTEEKQKDSFWMIFFKAIFGF